MALDADLSAILHKARGNNLRDELTGSLLANRAWFVQVLEGPSKKLMTRLNKILSDTRHKDILIFEISLARERMFNNWSMHYSSLDEVEPAMVWECVDYFRKGSSQGGRSAIQMLIHAAERSASRIAQ